MPNSLTRQAGLKLGPIFLDTLVKHYFERMRKDNASKTNIQLRQDELLYDETFVIVKVRDVRYAASPCFSYPDRQVEGYHNSV